MSQKYIENIQTLIHPCIKNYFKGKLGKIEQMQLVHNKEQMSRVFPHTKLFIAEDQVALLARFQLVKGIYNYQYLRS